MERLVIEEGFQCVRFNPLIWPNGEKMSNEVIRFKTDSSGMV